MSSSTAGTPTIEAPGRSRGWKRVRRVLSSVLVALATVYLGILLGKYVAHLVRDCQFNSVFNIEIKWGLAGVGLSYLLGSLEKVLKLAHTFREYIANPDKKVSLYPDCVALVCITTYLTVLAIAFRPGECDKTPTLSNTVAAKEVVYLSRVPQGDAIPVEYIPFLFVDLAAGDKNPSQGTTLGKQQLVDLERIVKSFKACASAGQDVMLAVRGYADTNEFAEKSDAQNVSTANRRAAELHRHLKRLIEEQNSPGVRLADPHEWKGLSEMNSQRYFNTLPLAKTGKDADQGLFNRRADILIMRLGACERLLKVEDDARVLASPSGATLR